jgi:uncharacterized protein with GYD domain
MPTYVMLANWTDQGVRTVEDGPKRVDAVAARFTLLLGKQGNVRTQSLKAFPEEAYRQIVNTLR